MQTNSETGTGLLAAGEGTSQEALLAYTNIITDHITAAFLY